MAPGLQNWGNSPFLKSATQTVQNCLHPRAPGTRANPGEWRVVNPVDDLKSKIAGLSPAKRALLERKLRESSQRGEPALRRRENREQAPLSFSQQRLWLIYQLDPSSYLYNVPRALRLRGKLDLPALEQSLNEIVARHEVLRSVFVSDGEQPVQKVLPSAVIPLPVSDVANEGQVQRVAVEEIQKPFDLARG